MARLNVTTYFKKLLLQFVIEQDPLLAMLQWLMQQMMQLQADPKVGVEKNKQKRRRRSSASFRGRGGNATGSTGGRSLRSIQRKFAQADS